MIAVAPAEHLRIGHPTPFPGLVDAASCHGAAW